jgi:uncharacterized protein YnzC (UPF0291/DUF896 family)
MEYSKEYMNLKENIPKNSMNIERYNELYNSSKTSKLSYDDQEELLKISTQILINLLKSDLVVQEALSKLQNRH